MFQDMAALVDGAVNLPPAEPNRLVRLHLSFGRLTIGTHVVRVFPNGKSCLRLVPALAVETHESWLETSRYLNMEHLREYKKMRAAA
jgi:putative transposase